jgi:hypothetical protein
VLYASWWINVSSSELKAKAKAVPLHAMKALVGREGIPPHS